MVAIKCVQKNSLSKSSVDNIINEISITKRIKNKFIVELKDFKWSDTHIYLIFEYCSGGELAQLIRKNHRFPEPVVRHFLQQMATALKVLRSHSVAHMDLKPHNILIASKVSEDWRNVVLKIADFGFAQYLQTEDFGTSLRGSPLYMAPEILLGTKYDASVDLWSVGIILYECLFGSAPFTSDTFDDLAFKIKSPDPIEIPATVTLSDNCRDLLNRLLQRDPRKRISFGDFFDHPFIDLEHMPSKESYAKGVQLIREAVQKDVECDYNQSFRLYTEGLQYLVPIHDWGDGSAVWDQSKRQALRSKLVQYMERAEEIKTKCNLVVVDTQDLNSLRTACECIENANRLIQRREFSQAFVECNKAIEIGFTVLPKLKANERTLLYQELSHWIATAEQLKAVCDKKNDKREKSIKSQTNRRHFNNRFVSKISEDLNSSTNCYVQ